MNNQDKCSEVISVPKVEIPRDSTPQQEANETFSSWKDKKHEIKNKHLEENQKERRKYSHFAFHICMLWICFLCIVTIHQMIWHKGLATTEFVTLITTTTTAIFANWYLVGKYLFYKEKGKKFHILGYRNHQDR